MNKNLEVAKKIIRAYWREVASDAEWGYSSMNYKEVISTLFYLDDDIERHIKAVEKIMREALKELQKEEE